MVEATSGEEGDETDMARFRVTLRNVEGGARLKQREVDLDDAIVEDMPPSKIAQNSLKGGSEKVSFKYGSRDGVGMVRRGSIEAERLSSSSLKELVKEYTVRNNKAGMQDFDELMTSIRQHHDDPRRVLRCVVVLLFWLCEHTNLVKPLHPEESLGIIKWRTMDLVKAFKEVALNELKSDQVVSRQLNVRDTHMFSWNIDNDGAVLSRDKIENEGRNGSAKDGNGTECSKRNYTLVTGYKGASARTP
ncbi:hypothetical protein RHGRI_016547 [Rhododendron griersonianum]|uniref:Uncharacterized protein n=1 Tax=Rhododendron griersonianum TaxID=479676 RepID=A0AAV6JUW5_9ERIC|nr:hypothetical protein RHGRI_016547 [Rhododendron griersonianum]